MNYATVVISGNHACVVDRSTVTAGTVGGRVTFTFDKTWDGMEKTLVWKGSGVTLDDTACTGIIPAEVVAQAGGHLMVGVYGTRENTATPTLWADLGVILPGADPSGDESADPSLPVWAQLRQELRAHQDSCGTVKSVGGALPDGNGNVEPPGSDWNANETQRGFIQNKPFGEEWIWEPVQEKRTCKSVLLADGQRAQTLELGHDLQPGEHYRITLEGAHSYGIPEVIYFADGSVIGAEIDHQGATPFRLVQYYASTTQPRRTTLYLGGEWAQFTLEIGHLAGIREKKLEKRYLPEDLSATSDWNAAEGEPGHVQNRTHWAVPGNLEYVPECQPQFDEENGTFLVLSNVTVPEVGAECIVTWNGTDYPCTAQESPDMGSDVVFLGNGAPFDLPETQDPFAIAIGVEDGMALCMALPLDGTGELTFAVRGPGEVIHTLDPKYLDKPWLTQQLQQVLIPAQQALKEELSSEMRSYVDSQVPYVDLIPYVSEITWEMGHVKYHTALLSDEHANLLRYSDTVKIRYRMAGTYNYPETVLIHPIKNGTTRSRASFLETGHATDTIYAGGVEAVLVELEVGQNNYLKIHTSTHKLN